MTRLVGGRCGALQKNREKKIISSGDTNTTQNCLGCEQMTLVSRIVLVIVVAVCVLYLSRNGTNPSNEILVTERSCKMMRGHVDDSRHLLGIVNPSNVLRFCRFVNLPPKLSKFVKQRSIPCAEIIVGFQRENIRKVYVTSKQERYIHAAEVTKENVLETCLYEEHSSIDIKDFAGIEASKIFARWNLRPGHIRRNSIGYPEAIHLRSFQNEKTLSARQAAIEWIGDGSPGWNEWFHMRGALDMSFVSFCLNPRSVTIYYDKQHHAGRRLAY